MKLMASIIRSALAILLVSATAVASAQQSELQNKYAQPAQQDQTKSSAQSPANPASASSKQAPDASVPDASASAQPSPEPFVGAGDLIDVGVVGAPDFTQEIRVTGTGDAVLALAGPVHVAGLTAEQAQQLIREKLIAGGFFNDPQVTLLVKEYATQGVSVMGEVQKPGIYPIMGPRRLFDVISLAGGTTQKAGQAVTISHRKDPQKVETVRLSSNPQENMTANISVFPGDTVVVSRAGIVYVVGDVRVPTGVVLDNGGNLTVLQALAMAQGASPTAALNKAKIIRKTPDGQREIPVQLKKILASKSPDLQLHAEDILFVPSSAAKSVLSRSVNAAVSLAGTVVAYRVVY
jgi:polysaccharide export outer membrane protein